MHSGSSSPLTCKLTLQSKLEQVDHFRISRNHSKDSNFLRTTIAGWEPSMGRFEDLVLVTELDAAVALLVVVDARPGLADLHVLRELAVSLRGGPVHSVECLARGLCSQLN